MIPPLNENHIYIDELLKRQIKIGYIYFYIKEISISKKSLIHLQNDNQFYTQSTNYK